MQLQVPTPFLRPPPLPRTAYAQSFNGTSQYTSSQYLLSLGNYNRISVGFFLNWTTFANNDKLAMEYSANYNNGRGFIFDPNSSGPDSGKFDVGVNFSNSIGLDTVAGFTRPTAGVWHHIMAMFDGRVAGAAQIPAIYADGISQSLTYGLTLGTASPFFNQTLYLMSRAGTSLFGAGAMSNLTIYREILTPVEVMALAQGTDPRLVGNGTLSHFWTLSVLHPEPNLAWNAHTLQMIPSTTTAITGPHNVVNHNIRNSRQFFTEIVGTTSTSVFINIGGIIEWGNIQQNNQPTLTEFGTVWQRDAQQPAEFSLSTRGDIPQPVEFDSTARADGAQPVDLGNLARRDAGQVVEFGSTILSDRAVPVEIEATTFDSAPGPAEFGVIARGDTVPPTEIDLLAQGDPAALLAWGATLANDAPQPSVWGSSLTTDRALPLDLGTMAAVSEAVPIEWEVRLDVRADHATLIEFGSVTLADATGPLDLGVGAIADGMITLEMSTAALAGPPAIVEWVARVAAAAVGPIEFGSAPLLDAPSPNETGTLAGVNSPLPAEWTTLTTTLVAGDSLLSFEWGTTLVADAHQPLALRGDRTGRVPNPQLEIIATQPRDKTEVATERDRSLRAGGADKSLTGQVEGPIKG